MKLLHLVAFLCLSHFVSSQTPDISYDTYCNNRYLYCIKYPDLLLNPQPEAYNGDGRIFTDKKGADRLRVYGTRENEIITSNDHFPLKTLYKMELNGGRYKNHPNKVITYKAMGKDYFVISGTEDGNIFYQKTIQLGKEGEDLIVADAILIYSNSEQSVYNQVAKQVFSSFNKALE